MQHLSSLQSKDYNDRFNEMVAATANQNLQYQIKKTIDPLFPQVNQLFQSGTNEYLSKVESKLDQYVKNNLDRTLLTSDTISTSMKEASVKFNAECKKMLNRDVLREAVFTSMSTQVDQLEEKLMGHKVFQAVEELREGRTKQNSLLNYINEEMKDARLESNQLVKNVEKQVTKECQRLEKERNSLNERFDKFTSEMEQMCRNMIIQAQKQQELHWRQHEETLFEGCGLKILS